MSNHGNDSWRNQRRNPAGEFGELVRAELDFDPDSINPAESANHARLKALAEDRHVPAAAAPAAPIEPVAPGEWWDRHAVLAEHARVGSNTYPRIPETGPSGRRTVRRQYKGAGVHLQTPSAAAIRRYATISGGPFDVPVRAAMAGKTADAWVRVTPVEGGGYRVHALGIPGGDNAARVSEAVNSVLEARRVTVALDRVDDLVEKARARAQTQISGAEQKKIESWIASAGYDKTAGVSTITIADRNGKTRAYGYRIPERTHNAIYTSVSPGTLFNLMVKPTQDETRVDVVQCPGCRRIHLAAAQHVCAQMVPEPNSVADVGFRRRAIMKLKTRLRIN